MQGVPNERIYCAAKAARARLAIALLKTGSQQGKHDARQID
jgi:hypothetical protein